MPRYSDPAHDEWLRETLAERPGWLREMSFAKVRELEEDEASLRRAEAAFEELFPPSQNPPFVTPNPWSAPLARKRAELRRFRSYLRRDDPPSPPADLSSLRTDPRFFPLDLGLFEPSRRLDLRDSSSCLCPLHSERTPSFRAYRSDNHFHCFGCGAHGSPIDLVMLLNSVSFREALKVLGISP